MTSPSAHRAPFQFEITIPFQPVIIITYQGISYSFKLQVPRFTVFTFFFGNTLETRVSNLKAYVHKREESGKPKDTMLFHVIHTPAFHSLHGRGSVPDTNFGASGANVATYDWAPTCELIFSHMTLPQQG
jgi:hypothetical protein